MVRVVRAETFWSPAVTWVMPLKLLERFFRSYEEEIHI